MTATQRETSDDCHACVLHDRRSFLATAVGAIAAAAVLLPGAVQAESMSGLLLLHVPRAADGTATYPVPLADGATFDVENEVILVRSGGMCMAFALSCPHQRAMLKIKGGDTAFRCPKHKSEYRIDGGFIRGRATRNMDRRSLRKAGAEIIVDVTSVIRSDQDAARWAAAAIQV